MHMLPFYYAYLHNCVHTIIIILITHTAVLMHMYCNIIANVCSYRYKLLSSHCSSLWIIPAHRAGTMLVPLIPNKDVFLLAHMQ